MYPPTYDTKTLRLLSLKVLKPLLHVWPQSGPEIDCHHGSFASVFVLQLSHVHVCTCMYMLFVIIKGPFFHVGFP